jgi:hypothetical protein
LPAYDVLAETLAQELSAQLSTADAIDAKAATVFSAASTIAAIGPALLPLARSDVRVESWTFVLLLAGIASYAVTLILFVLVYRVSTWEGGPRATALARVCEAHDSEYARRWVADAYSLSIRLNARRLDRKASYLGRTIPAFVLEVVMLAAAGVSTVVR